MLKQDLEKLADRYTGKVKYFAKCIENNTDYTQEKKLIARYEFSQKALKELQTLRALYERTFK